MKPQKWITETRKMVLLEELRENNYLLELFTHENDFIKEFLLDWLAYIIQNNNKPIRRYLLVRDRSGGALSYWFLKLLMQLVLPLKFSMLIRTYKELEFIQKGSLVIALVQKEETIDEDDWLSFFEHRNEINMIIVMDTMEHFKLTMCPYYSTFETSILEARPIVSVDDYARKYLLKRLKKRDIHEFSKWVKRYMAHD